ncbi:MAG TPA: phosphoglycerate mutase family protein [Thermoplasmata archaeon]|nr:phosphoglycerate mutase family protein [Thermoplasmata archaeon]
MRVVEHRRHSRRDPGGVHLNVAGLELARRVAPTLGRFDRVITSPVQRAVDTAEALGFPPDSVVPELSPIPEAMDRLVESANPRSFADYVHLTLRRRRAAMFAEKLATLVREELTMVPDGGSLLVISHGGVVEFSAAGARPEDALSFGPTAGLLEGVRLFLEGREWVRGEVVRVPK